MLFQHTTGFTRGEVYESVWDRADMDFYVSAAKRVENWLIDITGGLRRRPPIKDVFYYYTATPGELTEANFSQQVLVFRDYVMLVIVHYYPGTGSPHVTISANLYKRINEKLEYTGIEAAYRDLGPVQTINNDPISLYLSFVSAGPSMFITSPLFPPQRAFLTESEGGLIPALEEIIWYEELLGTISVENGSATWTGVDTLFQDQLSVGSTFYFRGQAFTVATIVSQEELTTNETYTGLTLAGERVEIIKSNPFGGNPRLCTFYKSRLFLFTTDNNPTKMWASKIGSPFIIIPGSTYDDAPINYELFSEGVDEFVWVISETDIYLGSSRAEYMVSSGTEGPITPTNFGFTRISSLGGSGIQPVISDSSIIFTNRDRTRIFGVRYDYQREGFISNDLTLLAPHLFEDKIRELQFRPSVSGDSTPRLFALLDSGKIRTAALSEEQNVVAWSRFDVEGGFVPLSIASSSDGLFVFFGDMGNKVPGEGMYHMLTWYAPNMDFSYIMDFPKEYTPTPENKITNMEMFHTYRTVAVVSDLHGFLGFYDVGPAPDSLLGELDLSHIGGDLGRITVGIPFVSRLEMLPVVFDTGRGLSLNRKIRMLRAMLSVRGTYQLFVNDQPLFGVIGAQLGKLPERNGVFEKRMLGWLNKDMVTVESASVYPATILSITREVGI